MPLNEPASRREIHHRTVDMRTFERDDGLYDVEARLIDQKPFPFLRESSPQPVPAGQSLHDLWVRVTVDEDLVVRNIEAASDVTPWKVCKESAKALDALVGEKIARGWSFKVKEKLRGAAGCTHQMEMLITMATTALQGIRGIHPEKIRGLNAEGVPIKLDSCFAYGREREVVKMLWPSHHVTQGQGL